MEKKEALEIICMIADGLNPYLEDNSGEHPPELNPVTIRALCKSLSMLLSQKDKKEIRTTYRERSYFETIGLVDGPLKKFLKSDEKKLILKTLSEVDYESIKAAQNLNMPISIFEDRVGEYQLEDVIFANRYLDKILNLDLSLDDKLECIETQLISEALYDTGHNKNKAAELLGITFRSLRYKIEKHKSSLPEKPETSYLKVIDDRSLEDILGIIEYESIKRALGMEDNNKTLVAQRLGITFRSLRYRMEKFEFQDVTDT